MAKQESPSKKEVELKLTELEERANYANSVAKKVLKALKKKKK